MPLYRGRKHPRGPTRTPRLCAYFVCLITYHWRCHSSPFTSPSPPCPIIHFRNFVSGFPTGTTCLRLWVPSSGSVTPVSNSTVRRYTVPSAIGTRGSCRNTPRPPLQSRMSPSTLHPGKSGNPPETQLKTSTSPRSGPSQNRHPTTLDYIRIFPPPDDILHHPPYVEPEPPLFRSPNPT